MWKVLPHSLRPTVCVTSHSVSSLGPTIVRPRPTEIRTRISAVRVMLRRDNRSTIVLSPICTYIKYQLLKPITPTHIGIHHAVTEAFPPTAVQTTAESASRASLGASPIIRRLQSGEFQYSGLSAAQSLLVQLMQLLCTSTVDTPRLSCEYSPFTEVHVLALQLCRCEPHYLLLIGMRGSVLQQNFHGASNMYLRNCA
jgi:hypothetical protein